MNSQKLNIIIGGYIVGGPLGGLVWHHLQYVLGLHQMGHNVLFVEDSDDYPSCYNPQTHLLSDDPFYGLSFIDQVFSQYQLQQQWAYYHQPANRWYGKSEKEVKDFISKTDLFLNLSGVNPLREYFLTIPLRVLLDTDPVFTQIRNLTDPPAMHRAKLHNRYFSFGENFGKPACSIPNDGLNWQPTRQPVFLKAWKYTRGNSVGKWTTVMQWDSYKVREYNGKSYGMKSASFDDYFSLPSRCKDVFELAAGSETTPREKLLTSGWQLADPIAVTVTPASFQQYLRQSKGEWSIAKQGYVSSYSGWFSERSTGYLSSGRPVVVQDTGFSGFMATGKGLLSFNTPDEAVAAIEEVNRNYAAHCNWAREIAEEYFRFDKVLSTLLQDCLVDTPIY
ncbi:MAG: hypothetical protein ABIN01_21935 [Ferruginibacter sp.]